MRLHYRALGDDNWRQGTSANMSRTGVLFQGERPLGLRTPVELSFELPVSILGERGAQVICRGEIARSSAPGADDTPAILAATIEAYQFVRVTG